LQSRRSQFLGNFLRQFRHVVAESTRAERAEVGEILAELRGLDAGGLRECLARNRADAVLFQPCKAAQINRKAINRLARDFRTVVSFQSAEKLSKSFAQGKCA